MRQAILAAAMLAWAAIGAARGDAPPLLADPGERASSLDKSVIRRVIHQHMAEVRRCYETALAKDPALQGRVLVRFVISAEGDVLESQVKESTLGDPTAEGCIAGAVRGWTFPRGPGKIIVVYPFAFRTQPD